MAERTKESICIIGAGLAGALLAVLLARRGYRVDVFERRPDPRAKGFIGGRSINLALSTRGITAIRRAGIADDILRQVIPMRGRMMHDRAGELVFQPYSKSPDDVINSVSRSDLNLKLLNAAGELDNVTLHFGMRCEDIDVDAGRATFRDADDALITQDADLLIGADGAFSAVRSALQRTDRFNYSQTYLDHGYKELTIPPTADGDFAIDPNALHIWPRGGSMMIALPNEDRSFTCTLFWPFQGDHGFDAIRSRDDVKPFFEKYYGDAVPIMPTLVDDYETNPVSSLVTVRCAPWHRGDQVLILGDAAHAIVPFYGQGMNAAFEDCAALDALIEQRITNGTGDWTQLIETFSRQRVPNANAIADMALTNFIEMRDHVGSRWFRFKKRVEKVLHRAFPGSFMPLYNMVSFSNIPYAEALGKARRQRRTIVAATAGVGFVIFIVGLAVIQQLVT
ncbi:MAG: NAD(P)/FAD-dependent oxidoreductase [Planctomycetota bacterium]